MRRIAAVSLLALIVVRCALSLAAMQTFPQPAIFPGMPNQNQAGGAPNTATVTLDNTADRAALVFQAPKTGSISEFRFFNTAVAGASGNVVLDCRIETVDATNGAPTGTLWATNTNGSVTVQFNGDNSWQVATMTANASVVQGDAVAFVINPTTFTTVTSIEVDRFADNAFNTAYSATDLTGVGYAKSVQTPGWIAGYSDGTYVPILGVWPHGLITTANYNTGSATTRRALKFQLAFDARCSGAQVWINPAADFDVKLYDSDGSTVLATKSVDVNILQSGTVAVISVQFTSSASLLANTNYYLSVEPTTVTNISAYHTTGPTAAAMGAFPGGANLYLSLFTSGAWADTTTARPFFALILDGFDVVENQIFDSTIYDSTIQ